MSKRAEWARSRVEGTANELRVGDLVAVAHDACSCGCGVGPEWLVRADVRAGETDTVDRAKELAKGKLREIRDALNEHFAPVLRWEDIHPTLSSARLGDWMIDVTSGGWYVFVFDDDERVCVRRVHVGGEHFERKRAAEAALRALGVVFRTEGE